MPEPLAKQLQNAVGFAFLGIGLSVSSYVGYSYHGIAIVNQALSAQIPHRYSKWVAAADHIISRMSDPELVEHCTEIMAVMNEFGNG